MSEPPPQGVGRYQLKQELGRGGMATVFLAHDPRVDRDVAVKLLPREFLHDPMFRTRFEREAKTIAGLEHPAIVPLYDFGEEDGQPYLVMRYMSGGSLDQPLKKGPLGVEEAARIFARIGPALDIAHTKGIIHRDLKPGNILLDEQGHPYLSDFGIVKISEATAALTGSGVIGTPAYMSPEQASGKGAVDGRSDIYALGTILFEMLTGQAPYRADTPVGVVVMHITEPVPSILQAKSDLPPALETVIQKALAKDPDDRYQSAAELVEALNAVVAQRVAAAPPPVKTTVPAPRETALEEPTRVVQPAPAEDAVPLGEISAPRLQELPELEPARVRKGLPAWGWIGIGLIGLGILAGGIAGASGLFAAKPLPTETALPPTIATPTSEPSATPLPTATTLSPPTPTEVFSPQGLSEIRRLAEDTVAMEIVEWSPDGAYLAGVGRYSFYEKNIIFVWEVQQDWSQILSWESSTRNLADIDWSPDNQRIASAGKDGIVQIWDLESGMQSYSINVSTGFVESVEWSPDGTQLATASAGGNVKIWDAVTGELIVDMCCHLFNTLNAGSLTWSPDGSQLLSAGGDHKLRLWNVATGVEQRAICCTGGPWIREVAWSPTGELVASASQAGGGGGSLDLWDIESWSLVATLGRTDSGVMSLSWSPDSQYLGAVNRENLLTIWDVQDQTQVFQSQPLLDENWRYGYSSGISWAPDGRSLAVVSYGWSSQGPDTKGYLGIWGMPTD